MRSDRSGDKTVKKLEKRKVDEKEKKREIKSVSDFFGNSPVRQTTRSMRSDRSGDKTVKKLEKRNVDEEEGGERGELKTVPESPTEATVMEFSDEAVARALQEDELEMQKEKVSLSISSHPPPPPAIPCPCRALAHAYTLSFHPLPKVVSSEK